MSADAVDRDVIEQFSVSKHLALLKHFGRHNVMTIKTKFAAVSVAAALALSAASTAYAACHMKVMHHMAVTTDSGKQLSLEVVKMDGHMMILVPAGMAPDIFHRKVDLYR
ncbi:MAG: hypothetical protein ACYC5H_02675 [Methylovirgula sp.]